MYGGYYAGAGELSVWAVTAAGSLGTVLGDNISYLLGRRGIVGLPWLRRLSERAAQVAEKISPGMGLLILVRDFPVYGWLAFPQLLVAIHCRFRRRLVLDALGAALCNGTFIGLAFVAGRIAGEMAIVVQYSQCIQLAFIAVLIGWTAFAIVTVRRSLGREWPRLFPAAGSQGPRLLSARTTLLVRGTMRL